MHCFLNEIFHVDTLFVAVVGIEKNNNNKTIIQIWFVNCNFYFKKKPNKSQIWRIDDFKKL